MQELNMYLMEDYFRQRDQVVQMPLDGGTCPYIQGISKRTVCWNRVSKVESSKVGIRDIIRDQIVTLKDIVMTLAFILSDLKNHWTF